MSHRIHSIPNFRDVAELCPGVAPGRLFRSGHTLFASDDDVHALLADLQVRTVIDLRKDGDREIVEWAQVTGPDGPDARYTNRLRGRLESVPCEEARASPVQQPSFVSVPLDGHWQILRFVWQMATLWEALLIVIYSLFCCKARLYGLFAEVFSRHGLHGFNCALVSFAPSCVSTALHVVATNSDRPLLVHCRSVVPSCLSRRITDCPHWNSLGKDRTGLVIALILAVLAVPLEDIIADYEQSAIAVPIETRKALLPRIVDRDQFSKADGDVIRRLFQFIDERYGGLDQYLDGIGFGIQARDRLRRNLLAKRNA